MKARELALVEGWSDTRATLGAWQRDPLRPLAAWLPLSAAITGVLLVAVAVVGMLASPDPTPIALHGLHVPGTLHDVATIFGRNLLVLALHAMACVAGFIAKSSLPREAEGYAGWWRRVHDHAGPAAIAFVGGATLFSLCTQALVLGSGLASLAPQLGATPPQVLLVVLPHAIPELLALFLPLAAWLVAARAQAWHELLAATFVTTALALPVLAGAALTEVYVTPHILRALHFV